jgi:hypothetical protein
VPNFYFQATLLRRDGVDRLRIDAAVMEHDQLRCHA